MGQDSDPPFIFRMLSFRISTDKSSQPAGSQYVLLYKLPDAAEPVKVEVTETETRYFMVPLDSMLKTGSIQYFAWDADYASAHKILPDKLDCILNLPAKTMWDDFTLVPAVIGSSFELPQAVNEYQLIFYCENYDVHIAVSIKNPDQKEVFKDEKHNYLKEKEALFAWKPLKNAKEGK